VTLRAAGPPPLVIGARAARRIHAGIPR